MRLSLCPTVSKLSFLLIFKSDESLSTWKQASWLLNSSTNCRIMLRWTANGKVLNESLNIESCSFLEMPNSPSKFEGDTWALFSRDADSAFIGNNGWSAWGITRFFAEDSWAGKRSAWLVGWEFAWSWFIDWPDIIGRLMGGTIGWFNDWLAIIAWFNDWESGIGWFNDWPCSIVWFIVCEGAIAWFVVCGCNIVWFIDWGGIIAWFRACWWTIAGFSDRIVWGIPCWFGI